MKRKIMIRRNALIQDLDSQSSPTPEALTGRPLCLLLLRRSPIGEASRLSRNLNLKMEDPDGLN